MIDQSEWSGDNMYIIIRAGQQLQVLIALIAWVPVINRD